MSLEEIIACTQAASAQSVTADPQGVLDMRRIMHIMGTGSGASSDFCVCKQRTRCRCTFCMQVQWQSFTMGFGVLAAGLATGATMSPPTAHCSPATTIEAPVQYFSPEGLLAYAHKSMRCKVLCKECHCQPIICNASLQKGTSWQP